MTIWFEVKQNGQLLAEIGKNGQLLAEIIKTFYTGFGNSLNILTILLTIVGVFWNSSLVTTRIRGQYGLK